MININLENLFEKIAGFIYRRHFLVLVFSLFLLAISFIFVSSLKINPSFEALIPDDHPIIKNIHKLSDIYGGVGSVDFLIRGDDYAKTKAYVDHLVPLLEKHKEVRYVDYRKPVEYFKKRVLLYLKKSELNTIYFRLKKKFDYERLKNNPLMLGIGDDLVDPGLKFNDIIDPYKEQFSPVKNNSDSLYFHKVETINGKKRHTFAMLIKPAKPALDNDYSLNLIDDLLQIARKDATPEKYSPSIKIDVTGRYLLKAESMQTLGQDFKLISVISAVGILLILFGYFRSIVPMLLVFSSLIIGVVYTLAFTQIVFTQLNIVTSLLVAILFGLGIDFGVHFLLRYKEEIKNHSDKEKAFKVMFAQTGVASFTSAVTTSVAFYTLILSGFRSFQEFGAIAGTGVLLTLFAMMFVLCPLIVILDANFGLKVGSEKFHMKLPARLWKRPKIIAIIGFIALVIGFLGVSKLKFNYDFSHFVKYEKLNSYRLSDELDAMFNTAIAPMVVIAKDLEEEKKIIKAVNDQYEKNKDNKEYRLDRAAGVSSLVPNDQAEKFTIVKRIRYLINKNKKYRPLIEKKFPVSFKEIDEAVNVKPISIESIPYNMKKNFMGVNKNHPANIVLIFPHAELEHGRQVLEMAEQLRSIKVDGKSINVSSDTLVFAEILERVENSGVEIFYLSILMVFFVSAFNFRSISKGFIVLLPLLAGFVYMLGTLGWVNLSLDFINVLVLPIMVGIGVDSGVHIYHRYLETNDIIYSVQNTGEAVALASLTTLWAFFSLTFSTNRAIKGMGWVAFTGIVTTYLTAVIILPAIVTLINKYRKSAK